VSYEYQFRRELCWYIQVCNKARTDECYPGCIRYMEMDYLMQTSGIPRNKQYAIKLTPSVEDVHSFEFLQSIKEDIVNFVRNGESLYLYSENFGNGKTSWALKLLQKYFDEVWCGNGFKSRGVFIHVPTFLTKIREGISKKDVEFEELKERLLYVDLVVWDDIAATRLTDFDHSNLLTYIDTRKLKGLSNIYTGNLNEQQMVEALGNRLKSRVWNDSVIVQLLGEDRRGT